MDSHNRRTTVLTSTNMVKSSKKNLKKDLTLDLLMIMSDKVMVKFKVGDDKYEMEIGRWCNVCK